MSENKYNEFFPKFDSFIESICKEWKVPGSFTAIIKDGQVIYNKAFGKRDIEKEDLVDSNTQFRLASNSKAFTAVTVGILVDEGLIEWDKPIKNYIPDFKLFDDFATERVTVRDLLCHRTGVPGHDWAIHKKGLTRAECVHLMRYLEPNQDIRVKLQYNNKMVMLAAYVVECVTKMPWEEFLKKKILEPLDMNNTHTLLYEARQTGNFSENYWLEDDKLDKCNVEFKSEEAKTKPYPGTPAGGMVSCAADLIKWTTMNLSKGKFGNKQIISEKNLKKIQSPNMVDYWWDLFPEVLHPSGGLGWFTYVYNGTRIVSHGGSFGTYIYMVPAENLGIVFLQNLPSHACEIIPYYIIDNFMGNEPIDWNERYKLDKKKWDDWYRLDFEEKMKLINGQKQNPHRDLVDYEGVYEHPAYMEYNIKVVNEKLCFISNESDDKFELAHIDGDSFFWMEDGKPIMRFNFKTQSGLDGENKKDEKICAFTAPFEPLGKDIVVKKMEK